jgi:hypothetical protein
MDGSGRGLSEILYSRFSTETEATSRYPGRDMKLEAPECERDGYPLVTSLTVNTILIHFPL